MFDLRKGVANYLKIKYRHEQIEGPPEELKTVALDESLLIHDEENNQIWVIWLIWVMENKRYQNQYYFNYKWINI